MIHSAHDVSEGGLFVALLESAMSGKKGFDLQLNSDIRKDALLFGEAQSRVVVSISPKNEGEFLRVLELHSQEYHKLGTVTDTEITVDGEQFGEINDWSRTYEASLGAVLEAS